MWQFPPETSLLLIPAPAGTQWRVSSAGKGATPAVGTKVPLQAPPAPLQATNNMLGIDSTQQNTLQVRKNCALNLQNKTNKSVYKKNKYCSKL